MKIEIDGKSIGDYVSEQTKSAFNFGNVMIQNGTSICNDKIIINGEEIPQPPNNYFKANNTTISGNRMFINGYEWIGRKKQWKRTLRALWEQISPF